MRGAAVTHFFCYKIFILIYPFIQSSICLKEYFSQINRLTIAFPVILQLFNEFIRRLIRHESSK